MPVAVDQALYGYDHGHRLIASSTTIDKESGRTLRSVTDLKVGSSSYSYLTVIPLLAMQRHAFIRTWSAGPGFRPGSVWSHVLLMRHEDLDSLADFPAVLQQFSRPEVDSYADLAVLRTRYTVPMTLAHSRTEPKSPSFPLVARQLVVAAYGTAEPGEVVIERADAHDRLLVSLLGQMWPELRRTFGFRTRYRHSGSSVAKFAIEVVERASNRRPSDKPHTDAWVDLLARDLEVADPELRLWLWSFGREGPSDRTAVVPLVRIFADARRGLTTDVIDRVLAEYPVRDQMGSLKAVLFGKSTSAFRLSMWPAAEERRLPLALRASGALDLDELQIQDRLTALARTDAPGFLGAFEDIDWDALDDAGRDRLMTALTNGLEARSLIAIASSWPELTAPLLSARPDTWDQSEVWSNPEIADVVRALLAEAPEEAQMTTLCGLVAAGQNRPAVELCEHHPTIWWSLLNANVAATLLSSQVALDTTRAVLSQVGTRAVGAAPFSLVDLNQLEVLANVSDPDDGLWRTADATSWLEVVKRIRAESRHSTRHAAFNAQVIALAAAEVSLDLRLRETTWQTVFGDVHRHMARLGAPNGAQRTLNRTLPNGPKWDWCARLREGLARVAVEGDWNPGHINSVASGAGDFAGDVARRVKERTENQNEGFLDVLKGLFRM